MAQAYYQLIVSTVNTISLISLAFTVDFVWLMVMFPFLIFVTWLVGYYMDKKDITAEDAVKCNEMLNRYINTADIKAQEFQMFQFQALIESLKSLQDKKPIDAESLTKRYEEYMKRWRSPEGQK